MTDRVKGEGTVGVVVEDGSGGIVDRGRFEDASSSVFFFPPATVLSDAEVAPYEGDVKESTKLPG